jgi:hypothetical protein
MSNCQHSEALHLSIDDVTYFLISDVIHAKIQKLSVTVAKRK